MTTKISSNALWRAVHGSVAHNAAFGVLFIHIVSVVSAVVALVAAIIDRVPNDLKVVTVTSCFLSGLFLVLGYFLNPPES
jgi:hypothetical protein